MRTLLVFTPRKTQLTTCKNTMASHELAATYASLILADEGVEITSDKIVQLTTAAGVPVEPIWAQLLAKALEGKDLKDLLFNIGASTGPAAPAAPAAGGDAPAAEAAEEKKEEEKKEESDEDVRTLASQELMLTTPTDGLRSLRLNSFHSRHRHSIIPWCGSRICVPRASVFTIQLRLRRGKKCYSLRNLLYCDGYGRYLHSQLQVPQRLQRRSAFGMTSQNFVTPGAQGPMRAGL